MAQRTDFHRELCTLLASLGANYWGVTTPLPGKTISETVYITASEHAYYQPPENIKMKYPCVVYEKRKPSEYHADNRRYVSWPSFTITAISRDPDDRISEKLLTLPYCAFDRRFVSDNLYHDVYTIYY